MTETEVLPVEVVRSLQYVFETYMEMPDKQKDEVINLLDDKSVFQLTGGGAEFVVSEMKKIAWKFHAVALAFAAGDNSLNG